ncbi:MAG TPA: crossover junction endodeoxyribonuclease RuvC [Deltaproteobacteria bacterium]|nr:MAG: crossover junction endodeoxyribonuclease RuvC [Deltaproteobacteria bacterium GWA2_45_12]HBF12216.1 crossover junction endodeoxyribonuclease RuvC [Deltaproteobacteria bacterium]
MIILGIDPGTRIAGYGLIKKKSGQVIHIDNGIIDCQKIETLPGKLEHIFKSVQKLISQFHPTILAIEDIFYAKNVQSTVKLAHTRGIVILAAQMNGLEVHEISPLEVKKAVVGYGRAEKTQVQQMIKLLLKLPQIAEENASDALAVAVCVANSLRPILEKSN